MDLAVLLLLFFFLFSLQQSDPTLAVSSGDGTAGQSHSRKRRNLVYLQGAIIQVKLFRVQNVNDLY
jgi:hypothetical protein